MEVAATLNRSLLEEAGEEEEGAARLKAMKALTLVELSAVP